MPETTEERGRAGHVVVFDDHLDWSIEHTPECREHPDRPMSECATSRLMLAMTAPPVLEPGRYRIESSGHQPIAVLDFVLDENARPRGLLQRLEDGLAKQGGQLVVTSDDGLVLALTFGQEAEDSDMAGGAAYGMGEPDELAAALEALLDEAGWL